MEKKQELTIVDKGTGELFQLPEILKPIEEGAIVYSGEPVDMRAMLKDHNGHFSIKGVTNQGNSLEFTLINFRLITGIRPSAAYETPADFAQIIAFGKVGTIKTFFCLTIGGVSANAAKDFIPTLQVLGGAIKNKVQATIENKTNDKKQKFGVVTFQVREASKDEIAELQTAIQTFPGAMANFSNIPNIDAV